MNKVLQYIWVSQLLDLNGGRQVRLSLIIALYDVYNLFSLEDPSRRGEGKSWGGGGGSGAGAEGKIMWLSRSSSFGDHYPGTLNSLHLFAFVVVSLI